MEKYNFISENTLDYTSWHDCFAERFYKKDNHWIMETSGIDIEKNHPLNPDDTAYNTDKCIVIFENPVLIDYVVDTYNEDFNIKINDNIYMEHLNLMSYYEINNINRNYRYAEIGFFTETNDYMHIIFLFKKSIIMWNKFESVSWYERDCFKSNREKAYQKKTEIMKMLSENNCEEVQQKGIELAKTMRYIGDFIQPFFEGESKSLWKNCAKVISERTDDELTNWLLVCSFWLQDMNHPGAEIIAERLKAFSNKEKSMREKQNAIRIAEIIGDEEWLDNLKEWL